MLRRSGVDLVLVGSKPTSSCKDRSCGTFRIVLSAGWILAEDLEALRFKKNGFEVSRDCLENVVGEGGNGGKEVREGEVGEVGDWKLLAIDMSGEHLGLGRVPSFFAAPEMPGSLLAT